MPARIRTFFHDSVNSTSVASVGTAFDQTNDKYHKHELHAGAVPFLEEQKFGARVEGIMLRVTSISGASKITIRLCLDDEGDYTVVPDVEATIALGVKTNTTGCVAYSVKVPIFQILAAETDALYLFFKTDAGSVTVAQWCMTWRET